MVTTNSLLQPLDLSEDDAQVVMGFGQGRLEADGLAVGCGRRLKLALLPKGVTQIVVRFSVIGLKPDGLPVVVDGFIRLFFAF